MSNWTGRIQAEEVFEIEAAPLFDGNLHPEHVFIAGPLGSEWGLAY